MYICTSSSHMHEVIGLTHTLLRGPRWDHINIQHELLVHGHFFICRQDQPFTHMSRPQTTVEYLVLASYDLISAASVSSDRKQVQQ